MAIEVLLFYFFVQFNGNTTMQKLQEAFRFIKKQEYDLAIVVLSDDGKEYAQVKIEAEVKVKIIIKNLIFFQKKVVIFYFIPFFFNIFIGWSSHFLY